MTNFKTSAAQTRWCRIGFVLCCAFPTLLICCWILFRTATGASQAQLAEWQHTLSLELGVELSAKSLDYPSYDTAILRSVELRDRETAELLATVRAVEVTAGADGTEVNLVDAIVTQAGFRQSSSLARDHVLRHPGPELPVRIFARQMIIELAAGPWSIHNPEVLWHLTTSGPEVQLAFTPPEASTREDRPAIRLVASRNREVTPPITRWQLATGSLSLPGNVLEPIVPSIAQLGSDVQFMGELSLFDEPAGLRGSFAGHIANIDLQKLITEQFPHTISGNATLDVERLILDRSRIASCRGTLQSQHGTISHSLLAALEKHLGVSSAIDLGSTVPTQVTPYRQLSIGFHLDEQQLRLTGSCDPTRDGVMLAAASGPLVEAPQNHATAAIALVRTLLPESDWQVPATQQTGGLVALLPAPPLSEAAATARAQQHVPTQLGPARNSSSITEPR